jgi:hypothetical protein
LDEEIVVPAMLFLTVVVMTIVIPVIKMWYLKQEALLKQPQLSPELSPELSRRLDRLEAMIETVSVEVERLAEGQRFTTRVLTEGAPPTTPQAARNAVPMREQTSEVTHA